MRIFVGIALLGAMALLSGCSAGAEVLHTIADDPMVVTSVDPDSAPAFLETEQTPLDLEQADDLTFSGVSVGSLRYQGQWEGNEVYLGVTGTSGVNVITGIPGDSTSWTAGSTVGNAVIGLGMSDRITLQYVPQGTADPPEGWSVLSDYVIVRP